MGILRLIGMNFYGYHGVSQAEKELGTRFVVDCEIEIDSYKPAISGKLTDTINYEQIYKFINKHITEKRFHLLETLTETLADDIMSEFKPIKLVLCVRKISPPFAGNLDYVELEVERVKARSEK